MIEIKFRSFYEVQGKYEPYYSNPLSPRLFWENLYRGIYDTDPEQYTGLKDVNGKEIYEGDIVLVDGHYDGDIFVPCCIGIVTYNAPSFYIKTLKGDFIDLFNAINNYGLTLMGNIHQNPELLDKG